jgi:hypothetical protein
MKLDAEMQGYPVDGSILDVTWNKMVYIIELRVDLYLASISY